MLPVIPVGLTLVVVRSKPNKVIERFSGGKKIGTKVSE